MTAAQREAIDVLWWILTGHSTEGWLRVAVDVGGGDESRWLHVPRDATPLKATVAAWRQSADVRVSTMVARERSPETMTQTGVLWVAGTGGEFSRRLSNFRPSPTVVLAEGSTSARTALWALTRALTWEWLVQANQRLAHALGAPKKNAQPGMMIRPPGALAHDGRLTPITVEATHLDTNAIYTPKHVVGWLPAYVPPTTDQWRKR